MRTLHIETSTHGRVLIRDAAVSLYSRRLVGFHGYGQTAEDIMAELEQIPGSDAWQLVSVQALHPFYTRDNTKVIASWMTRQDRELAIADNVAYVDRVLADDGTVAPADVVFVGFSQGASMAYRAAALGGHRAQLVVALGGDVPPEVKASESARFPPVLIGAGLRDAWFTPAKAEEDAAFFRERRVPVQVVTFDGAHEWTDAFRRAIGVRLDGLESEK